MADEKFVVSMPPHTTSAETTTTVMLDVIIALIPALLAGWFFFGLKAVIMVAAAVLACVISEFVYQTVNNALKLKDKNRSSFKGELKAAAEKTTIGDLSAVVTGILIAFNMPVSMPIWKMVIACVFAIVIVKQLFGGIGHNFVNPALAARAFIMASWSSDFTGSAFVDPVPASFAKWVSSTVQTSATPLTQIQEGGFEAMSGNPSIYQAFVGNIGGCIGEVSAAALLIGGIYLVIRRVIDVKIPLSYLLSFALLTFLFGVRGSEGAYDIGTTLYSVCTGGIMLGAIFMATDYVTTPTTGLGHVIFGIGCGLITFLIRRFGGYPEGTSYAILLMNVVSPLIDKYIHPKTFGEASGK